MTGDAGTPKAFRVLISGSSEEHTDRKIQAYVLCVIFIFKFCFGVIDSFLGLNIAFEIPIAGFSLFYLLLGRYVAEYVSNDARNNKVWRMLMDRKVDAVLIVADAALIILIEICSYPDSGEYLGYESPFIALLTLLVFMFVRSGTKNEGNDRWISVHTEQIWKLDRMCFGIYLIHPLFINFAYKLLKITPLSFGVAYPLGMIVYWLVFAILALIAAWFMNLIKPLKKYVL